MADVIKLWLPQIKSPQWNLSIVWSIMSAVIFSQILIQGQVQASRYTFYSINGVSVAANDSAFKFFIFCLAGWVQSWAHFHLATTTAPFDDMKFNIVGLVGLLAWVMGQVVYVLTYTPPSTATTIELLQEHYQFVSLIDILLITLGGSLFYWSVRTQQLAIFPREGGRILFGAYTILPSVCAMVVVGFSSPLSTQVLSFVQTYMYFLVIGLGPLTITLLQSASLIDLQQDESDDSSVPFGSKGLKYEVTGYSMINILAHGVFVVCSSTLFFIPFVHIQSALVFYDASNAEQTQATLVLLGGGLLGKVIVALLSDLHGESKWVLPVASFVQTISLAVWLGTYASYNYALLASIGFFLGLSSTSTFVFSHLKSVSSLVTKQNMFTGPVMDVFHMTCMVPGGALLVIITRSFTDMGSVDYYWLLTVALCLSVTATVSSIVASFTQLK